MACAGHRFYRMRWQIPAGFLVTVTMLAFVMIVVRKTRKKGYISLGGPPRRRVIVAVGAVRAPGRMIPDRLLYTCLVKETCRRVRVVPAAAQRAVQHQREKSQQRNDAARDRHAGIKPRCEARR